MAKCELSFARKVDRLQEIKRKLPVAADAIIEQSMDEGVEFMQRICPVDTGNLRSTARKIRVRRGAYKLALGHARGEITGIWVDYEPYIEFGTRYMAAQPTFHPAFQYAVSQCKKRFLQLEKYLGL